METDQMAINIFKTKRTENLKFADRNIEIRFNICNISKKNQTTSLMLFTFLI